MNNPFSIANELASLEDNKVHKFSSDQWGGESIGEYSRNRGFQRRVNWRSVMRLLKIGLLVWGLVVLGRLSYLQVIRFETLSQLALKNRFQVTRVMPARGKILDRNGITLVYNEPFYSVVASTESGQLSLPIVNMLARLLEMPAESIQQMASNGQLNNTHEVLIAEGITQEQAVTVEIMKRQLPGVSLVVGNKRVYPFGNSLSHVTGIMGAIGASEWETLKNTSGDYAPGDRIGKSGLESVYEKELRGHVGKKFEETDAQGRVRDVPSKEDPRKGSDLITTIDVELQEVAFAAVKRIEEKHKRAAVIVLDPQNGEVLALVSQPSFNSNVFSGRVDPHEYQMLIEDEERPLFQRAIAGEYPSGSTIKPVIALAALDTGVVGPETVIASTGGVRVDKWFFPDWKTGGHGPTNVVKALAESVNTYFYVVGGGWGDTQGLGIDKIGKYLEMFGIGSPLGIDLPNEQSGFVPSKEWKERVKQEPWYIGDTYHAAIGQGDVLVTPLQVAAFTSVIANNGTLFRPLIKAGMYEGGAVVRQINIPLKYFQAVREGMRAAVTSGSAKILNTLSIPIAGKTGTAQVGGSNEPHAWFTGYAPADHPRIVVTVLVENAGEGSSVATPIAGEIIQWFARNRI